MSNSCRQESLRLSLGSGGFLFASEKKPLPPSNSIPQDMKSIRKEWKCGSPEEESWWFFEQSSSESSSKTGVAPSYHTVIPSILSISTPPLNSNHSVKKGGLGCRFAGKILEECRFHS
ncbi:hypothetical protein CEXT_181911 [Caerostris extrusa]|uniref:Uncharacterized protein n=1 Tax=Caerostris extrusa TaxID=172846 RepID=A0AAV4QMB4_CAEEX|nr:hypothetical protein CEXT_181911 [Caerostris extrusa]